MTGDAKEPKFRKVERRDINFSTTASIPHADASITVVNLSATGCKIRTDSEAAGVGSTVLVRFSEREEAAGEIVWRQGEECGVHFHRPLSEDMLRHVTGWSF